MTRCCSQCGSNGHNSRTCDSSAAVGRGAGIGGGGSAEIMLFGFRVKVDPLRKTVSMNDLCNYEQAPMNANESTEKAVVDDADAGGGYVTADDALQHQNTGGRERKRGTPWTEEEHRLFLLGLQKVGKGDWRGISRNFVKSRTPTQVASHAQKYFIRKNNLNRRRRRSSLFDITTDSVTDESMDEGQVREDKLAKKPVLPITSHLPSTVIANDTKDYIQNHVQVVPVAPVFLPVQAHYSMNGMMTNYHLPSPSSMMYYSLPTYSSGVVPTESELNVDQEVGFESAPVSLRLSLSLDPYGQSSMRHSTLRTNLNDGNSTITVA